MRSRRFRRKASWIWAGADNLSITDGNVPSWSISELLPAGRVSWLLDNQFRRNSLTVVRILLWLEFEWTGPDTNGHGLFDTEFYIRKTTTDPTGVAAEDWSPYSSPVVPSTITTWSQTESDGMDPFLWTHWIKGISPPNAVVGTYTWAQSGAGSGGTNQQARLTGTASDALDRPKICRKFMVSQEWQPDVVVSSKRRLQRDDWLILGMRTSGFNTGSVGNLSYKTRILAH